MSSVKVYNGTCVSKPTKATKNKPSVEGRPYTMMFVRPSEMPPEWLGVRVKGTGKTPVLPEGMELVWSLTHDAWRVFNNATATRIESIEASPDTVDHIGVVHRQIIDTTEEMRRVYRPDLCDQPQEQQTEAL
jgi:hypothetical protein